MRFLVKLICIFLVLFLTNEYAHDYQMLESAFKKQQESYGIVFVTLSKFYFQLGLEYILLHITYLFIMSISIALITSNLLLMITLLVLIGHILNEQTRFFTGAMVSIAGLRYYKPAILISFLFHPAAFVLTLAAYFIHWFTKFKQSNWFIIYLITAYVVGFALKEVILSIGRAIGYDYSGSIYLDPISLAGQLFLFAIAIFEVFKKQLEEQTNQEQVKQNEVRAFILLCVVCSGFAIVSGRLLMVIAILVIANSTVPKFNDQNQVSKKYNVFLLLSVIVVFLTLLIRTLKFFGIG
ncbi:hypothetical protein KO505_07210 [Psychrosphaera sp. F3M07]|uniref:hypothetical protein n=1 Tax=Psychrosphaera sp. F3M07 TaxID=2841560 RepID=UPI001C0881BD|nr:hypothetical protein [Psychrosphaera sp. F3M07]MBU2917750.1 hypothetical protein [Psychrosphaera sp. F3M07]